MFIPIRNILLFFNSRTILIIFIVLSLNGDVWAISDGLLKRPRAAWEYSDKASTTDVDHLGLGWDAIYLAKKAEGSKKEYYYKVAEGEFNYFLNWFDKKKGINPKYQRYAIKGLTQVAVQTSNFRLALTYYQKALARDPNSLYFLYQYAKYLENFQKLDDAIKITVHAIKISPNKYKAKLHNYLGLLYIKNDQYDLAKSEVEKAEKQGGVNTNKLRRELQEHSQ